MQTSSVIRPGGCWSLRRQQTPRPSSPIRLTITPYASPPLAVTVMIDSAGQLGTVSSALRFKQDVADMGESTGKLLDLRPVLFRYKQHIEERGDSAPTEYGLIAEEVAEVFPDLVVYDEEGEPFTVKYHLLSSMLLNELQKQQEAQRKRDEAQSRDLEALCDTHARELEELRAMVAALKGTVASALDTR